MPASASLPAPRADATAFERDLWASPETRLLLLAARPDPVDLGAAIEQAVADGVVWRRVIGLARSHRLVPHVARLAHEPAVPEPARRRLGAVVQRAAARQLRLTGALEHVLGALREAEVPALAIKGPTLAKWLFGRPTARMSVDLDVLVHPDHIAAGVAAVERLGYEGLGASRALSPAEAEVVAREFALKDAAFLHPTDAVPLELHWRPFQDRRLRTLSTALAAGLSTTPGGGVGPPAAVGAYVLAHGASHGYRRLGWLADAAALSSRLDDDTWAEALALAAADGVEVSVLLGPVLAASLFGTPLPEPLRAPAERERRRLDRLAERCLARTPDAYGDMGPGRLLFQIGLYDRLSDRARHLGRFLLKPGDGELDEADLRDAPGARVRRVLARPRRLARSGGRWARRLRR